MNKLPFPLIIYLFLFCVASVTAQDNSCPSLNIASPDRTLPKGERGTYMANIDTKGKSLSLEYQWSASSAGREGTKKLEFDGQGTSQITVVFPEFGNSVFVTLKVKGFPESCPSEASDAIIVDLPPEATKLFDVQPGDVISTTDIEAAASMLNDHPNNQLFILSGHVNGKSSESPTTREAEIIRLLTDAGLSRDRITLQNVDADRELIQLWTVPPGANPPKCDECKRNELGTEKLECPEISVVGPEGITKPGKQITVQAKLSDSTRPDLPYRWYVKGADTFSGQGTSSITIETDDMNEPSGGYVSVSVEVTGLPQTCKSTASDEYLVTSGIYDRFPIDVYGDVPFAEEKARLDNLAIQVLPQSNTTAYILRSFKTGTSERLIARRMARIKNFLFGERKYPRDRFVIMVRTGQDGTTILDRAASGEPPPVCEGCRVYK